MPNEPACPRTNLQCSAWHHIVSKTRTLSSNFPSAQSHPKDTEGCPSATTTSEGKQSAPLISALSMEVPEWNSQGSKRLLQFLRVQKGLHRDYPWEDPGVALGSSTSSGLAYATMRFTLLLCRMKADELASMISNLLNALVTNRKAMELEVRSVPSACWEKALDAHHNYLCGLWFGSCIRLWTRETPL